MYQYSGPINIVNIQEFILHEKWKTTPYIPKNIPSEINQWKRFQRKFTSPWVVSA